MGNHWEVLKHGHIVVPLTPEDLMRGAYRYFEWCDMNPIVEKKAVTGGRNVKQQAEQDIQRPYSLKMLCLHNGITEQYIKDVLATKDEESMWYRTVTAIMNIIYAQNHEMATVGLYNPAFTAKTLGIDLGENSSPPLTVKIIENGKELSNSETELLEKMNLEFRTPKKIED